MAKRGRKLQFAGGLAGNGLTRQQKEAVGELAKLQKITFSEQVRRIVGEWLEDEVGLTREEQGLDVKTATYNPGHTERGSNGPYPVQTVQSGVLFPERDRRNPHPK